MQIKKKFLAGEMFAFIMDRKAYWLLPLIILLLLVAAFIFIAASPAAVFLYPLI